MINLLQRVSSASVQVKGETVAAIGIGIIVLVGFEDRDVSDLTDASGDLCERMAKRLLGYRIFADENDRMNLNVVQAGGELLLVPQFTLAADTRSGLRPGFQTAAPPDQAKLLFDRYVATVQGRFGPTQQGQFGADMQVSLVNNGPVTFWLQL